jgi:cell division protein FtsL
MIVQRYAVGTRPAPRTRPRRPSLRDRLAARPAISGRERIAEKLGESLVVQLMLVMSLIVLALIIYLYQASQVSVLDYNIAYLQTSQSNLRQQNARLTATQSILTSPARIEAAATTFHMTKPDMSTTIWVNVPVPRVRVVRPVSADQTAAQQRSEPAAWLKRAISFVKSSL